MRLLRLYKALKGLIRPFKGLISPYKTLRRPLRNSFGPLGPRALRVPIIGLKRCGGALPPPPPPHTTPALALLALMPGPWAPDFAEFGTT